MKESDIIDRCAEANLHRVLIMEMFVMVFNLQEERRAFAQERTSPPRAPLKKRIIALRGSISRTILDTTYPDGDDNAEAIRRLTEFRMKEFFEDLEGRLLPIDEMSG